MAVVSGGYDLRVGFKGMQREEMRTWFLEDGELKRRSQHKTRGTKLSVGVEGVESAYQQKKTIDNRESELFVLGLWKGKRNPFIASGSGVLVMLQEKHSRRPPREDEA